MMTFLIMSSNVQKCPVIPVIRKISTRKGPLPLTIVIIKKMITFTLNEQHCMTAEQANHPIAGRVRGQQLRSIFLV